MKTNIATKAVEANLEVLAHDLEGALEVVKEALTAAQQGERNQAIGGLSRADRAIKTAPALLEAILAIHYRAEPQSLR
jgi:hypothetical protein